MMVPAPDLAALATSEKGGAGAGGKVRWLSQDGVVFVEVRVRRCLGSITGLVRHGGCAARLD